MVIASFDETLALMMGGWNGSVIFDDYEGLLLLMGSVLHRAYGRTGKGEIGRASEAFSAFGRIAPD